MSIYRHRPRKNNRLFPTPWPRIQIREQIRADLSMRFGSQNPSHYPFSLRETGQLTPRHRRRRWRRIAVGAGLTTIALMCFAALFAGLLAQLTPAWWNQSVDTADHSPLRATGFESLFVTELNKVRDGKRSAPDKPWQSQPWAVVMQGGDVNAWLEFAAPKWAKNQSDTPWPPELESIRVHFEDDQLLIGACIRSGSRTHILSARLSPRIDDSGGLWFTTCSVSVGRLTLPPAWVLRHAPALIEHYLPPAIYDLPESAQIFAALEGVQPAANQAVIRLADGRRVQILKLHSTENRLEIVAQTQQR